MSCDYSITIETISQSLRAIWYQLNSLDASNEIEIVQFFIIKIKMETPKQWHLLFHDEEPSATVVMYKLYSWLRLRIAGFGKGIKPKRSLFFPDCAINTRNFRLRFTLARCAKSRCRKNISKLPEILTTSANGTVCGTKIYFGCHSCSCVFFCHLLCIRLVASGEVISI